MATTWVQVTIVCCGLIQETQQFIATVFYLFIGVSHIYNFHLYFLCKVLFSPYEKDKRDIISGLSSC